MSTEARIGIVAGLVIVVVASVYFFYGSDKKEADVLVSAGPQFFTPPKIPADAKKKTPPALPGVDPSRGSDAPVRPGHYWPGSVQPRPGAPLPGGVPRIGGAAGLPPGPDRVAAARPPFAGPMGPPEPKARADSSDDSTLHPPVPLRTGPSPALVEATRENLSKAAEAGGMAVALDGHAFPDGMAAQGRGHATWAQAPGGASPPGADPSRGSDAPVRPSHYWPGSVQTWPKKHRIAEGDTLSALADKYYGSSKSLPLILKANPRIKDPRALKVGDEITIPEPPKLTASDSSAGTVAAKPAETTPATAGGGRTYAVREGDSFYSIAAAELRDATRWTEIYKLNRELVKDDPKRLRPGMVIALP